MDNQLKLMVMLIITVMENIMAIIMESKFKEFNSKFSNKFNRKFRFSNRVNKGSKDITTANSKGITMATMDTEMQSKVNKGITSPSKDKETNNLMGISTEDKEIGIKMEDIVNSRATISKETGKVTMDIKMENKETCKPKVTGKATGGTTTEVSMATNIIMYNKETGSIIGNNTVEIMVTNRDIKTMETKGRKEITMVIKDITTVISTTDIKGISTTDIKDISTTTTITTDISTTKITDHQCMN